MKTDRNLSIRVSGIKLIVNCGTSKILKYRNHKTITAKFKAFNHELKKKIDSFQLSG